MMPHVDTHTEPKRKILDRYKYYPTKEELLDGYARVTTGTLLPDDMLWDVVGRAWYRADSTAWNCSIHPNVEYSTYVLRTIRLDLPTTRRTYVLKPDASGTPDKDMIDLDLGF